jgi:putative oxidoreductase
MANNHPAKTQYLIAALAPIYAKLDVFAWPLVRIMYGGFFIPHGCQKLFGWFNGNILGTAKVMSSAGIEPAMFWAYYIGTLEFFGGSLIVLGLFTRPIALLMAGFMFVGTVAIHWQFGYFWTNRGFSVPLLLFGLSIAFFIKGSGSCSLDRVFGREI